MNKVISVQVFLFGVLGVGIVWGVWWLILLSGILILVCRRSYTVLSIGILLDMWNAVAGISWMYIGFYFSIFLVTTIVVESIRKRLR